MRRFAIRTHPRGGFSGDGRVCLGGDPKHAGWITNPSKCGDTKLPTDQLGGAGGCGLGAGSVDNFVLAVAVVTWSRIRKWMYGWMLLLIPTRQTRINAAQWITYWIKTSNGDLIMTFAVFKADILPSPSFTYTLIANYIFVSAILF